MEHLMISYRSKDFLIKYKGDSFNPQPVLSRNLHYLMNDIRPIVSGIAILLPQIISVII
jgi:hypothetical protein